MVMPGHQVRFPSKSNMVYIGIFCLLVFSFLIFKYFHMLQFDHVSPPPALPHPISCWHSAFTITTHLLSPCSLSRLHVHINSQTLWQHTQDLHRVNPDRVLVLRRENRRWVTPVIKRPSAIETCWQREDPFSGIESQCTYIFKGITLLVSLINFHKLQMPVSGKRLVSNFHVYCAILEKDLRSMWEYRSHYSRLSALLC